MAAMHSAVLYLALPSLCVFLLLVRHADRNLGHKRTIVYFSALFAYGLIRANWLATIAKDELGSAFPYLINLPVIKIGGASLQEIIGWSVAATLAWLISDRLLNRLRISAGPYRTAAVGFFVLCAICLAVETAAIEADWWQWTLNQQVRPFFGRVPLVGLLDWGFVPFDFLLPFLVFAVPTSWAYRIPAVCLFALHFRFHSELTPLPEPLPLTLNELMHAAIFAFVLVVAVGEKSTSALPDPNRERVRLIPLLSATIVAIATATACVFVAHYPRGILASLPLLLLGIAAYAFPLHPPVPERTPAAEKKGKKSQQKKPRTAPAQRPAEDNWSLFYARVAIVIGIFVLTCFLRIPFNRRSADFVNHVQAANRLMNGRNWAEAESEIRKAIGIRPEHPGGHVLLGQLLVMQKHDDEALRELHQALKLKPTDLSGLVLASTLELKSGKSNRAAELAATGHRIYPDHAEFDYLLALANAGGLSQSASPTVKQVIQSALSENNTSRSAIMMVAFNLNDTQTLLALSDKQKPAR